MQRMQLCILPNRPFKEKYENTKKCNQCYYASSRVEKFMIQCEYYSVWKYNPNTNTNIFGPRIKTEYEYEYIRFEN